MGDVFVIFLPMILFQKYPPLKFSGGQSPCIINSKNRDYMERKSNEVWLT